MAAKRNCTEDRGHVWNRPLLFGMPCECGRVRWGEEGTPSGICPRCAKVLDDHAWVMEMGSFEHACPTMR